MASGKCRLKSWINGQAFGEFVFSFDSSDELKETMAKLAKKDPICLLALNKKIREIVSCDEKTIEHYDNSSYELSGTKHVHIASSFVLFFKVFKMEKHIDFLRLQHHDKAFRR
jgi:mRNA-degrading endonuclease YafQ of YafQ-DinJ toxin-antitoxin module